MESTSEIQPASTSSSSRRRSCSSQDKPSSGITGSTSSGTPKATTSPDNTIDGLPLVVVDGTNRYRLNHPIGKSTSNVNVYSATIVNRGNHEDAFVAIQVVHQTKQEQEYDSLFLEVAKNKLCNHPNILKIKKNFNYNDYLCVIMSLHDVTSLPTIMGSAGIFKDGLPENCIAVALREMICGVSQIHQLKQIHKNIGAGNIFWHETHRSIKLAYGPTIFTRNGDFGNEGSSANVRPLETGLGSLTHWGAPPEVYEGGSEATSYREASDVWLIGIAALELAYGDVKVVDRMELERLVDGIRVNQRLPNRGNDLTEMIFFGPEKKKENKMAKLFKGKTPFIDWAGIKVPPLFRKPPKEEKPLRIKEKGEEKVEKKGMKKVMNNLIPKWKGKGREKERKSFSKSFGKMVAGCLANDPKKRLTLEQLVHHKFFKGSMPVTYFEEVVIKRERDPVW